MHRTFIECAGQLGQLRLLLRQGAHGDIAVSYRRLRRLAGLEELSLQRLDLLSATISVFCTSSCIERSSGARMSLTNCCSLSGQGALGFARSGRAYGQTLFGRALLIA
jgi:hypothetical protein